MHAPRLPPRPAGSGTTKYHPVYRPFSDPGSEIRLLSLNPASAFEAPLMGTLSHALLADSGDFECLSYTWGEIGVAGSMFLSGHEFSIYESVDAALRRLRRDSEVRVLWLDAICINQEDNDEKSVQVPLMRQIYQQASQVYVYLGEAKDLDMLRMTLETFEAGTTTTNALLNGVKFWGKAVLGNVTKKNQLFSTLKALTLHDSYVVYEMRNGEVRELLCRPWWTRTWILQEAIVAKKVVFIYGPETFEWDIVAAMVAASRMDMGLGDSYHTTHAPEEAAIFARFEAIDELRRVWSGSGEKRARLLEILYNFRRQGCTNPRDRIFSFLGLAQMEGVLDIEVDYNLPLAEVYLRFARRMVDQTGSLDLLNCKREWRGVPPMGGQQVYAYHVYDQAKYHDIDAKVHRDSYKEAKRGWALLPPGWEFVMNSDGTRHFINHNTGQTQPNSPLEGQPPPRARHPGEYRICPEGWVREYDNVGRPTISYQPPKAGLLLEAAAAERALLADELASLPSWVPNWAAATQHDPHLLASLDTAVQQDLLCRASGDLAARIAPSPPNILSVEGLLFDTITQLSSPFHPHADVAHFYRKPQDPRVAWETLALSPDNENNPYRDRREAFLRLHVGDFVPEQPIPPTGDALENVTLWIEGDFRDGATLDELANMSIREYYLKKGLEVQVHSVAALDGPYSKCAARIHKVTSHRALFVTEGGYMGLASWNAQVGDQVVVLRGGKTPYLVRPVSKTGGANTEEEQCELVGEAYVQGIMMGEALSMGKEMRFFNMV